MEIPCVDYEKEQYFEVSKDLFSIYWLQYVMPHL